MNSTSLFNESKYHKQCGEVFLTAIGKIVIDCTLCDCKYESFQEYAKHLRDEHYVPGAMGHTSEDSNILEEGDLLIALNCDDESVSLYYESDFFDENEMVPIEGEERHELVNSSQKQKAITEKNKMLTKPPRSKPVNQVKPVRKNKQKKNSNERKYKCTECNYACSNKSNLAGHRRRHSTFKPYLCTECTKAFYTSSELKRHIAAHRGERPFLCHDCGSGFPSKDKLALHFKKHLNIRDKICSICGMKFYNGNLLHNHMKVHSNDRPFKCNFCNADFKRRTGLTTHVKTHQNKREYQCKLCPASFNQNPGLHSHMKWKHPGTSINGEQLCTQVT